jgi:hypothetical protein
MKNEYPCSGMGLSYSRAHCKPPVGNHEDGNNCEGCIVKAAMEPYIISVCIMHSRNYPGACSLRTNGLDGLILCIGKLDCRYYDQAAVR